MTENLKKISDLISNQETPEDEKRFKVAAASLVCNIIEITEKNAKRYCSLFQNNLNLEESKLSIDDKIAYIKKELNNNMYQVMQFLKILNKFAIMDGCKAESYREFEKIRDKFLKEHY
jgi:hypothetical protein